MTLTPVLDPTPPSTFSTLVRELAQFRYRLRLFLRFSEQAARAVGVTPLQHQLMLGAAGFTGQGRATISELAECLQMRHNAVVALVGRAARAGLVQKRRPTGDRRMVRVEVTARGRRILHVLTRVHRRELARFRSELAPIPARNARRTRVAR